MSDAALPMALQRRLFTYEGLLAETRALGPEGEESAECDTYYRESRILKEARLITLPYSEVCMHMKVAGMRMWAGPVWHPNRTTFLMVQLLNEDGSHFSSPITRGEAGWDMHPNFPTLTEVRDAS